MNLLGVFICRYLRGQAIYADSKETGKFGAVIQSITGSEVLYTLNTANGVVARLILELCHHAFGDEI